MPSKNTKQMFMILTFNGTGVIKMDATTRQSKQATSKHTKQVFMILTLDGSLAIKKVATTRRRERSPLKGTNERVENK